LPAVVDGRHGNRLADRVARSVGLRVTPEHGPSVGSCRLIWVFRQTEGSSASSEPFDGALTASGLLDLPRVMQETRRVVHRGRGVRPVGEIGVVLR
jgi:hypothetical protein